MRTASLVFFIIGGINCVLFPNYAAIATMWYTLAILSEIRDLK